MIHEPPSNVRVLDRSEMSKTVEPEETEAVADASEETDEPVVIPPKPLGPEPGFAWVRVKLGFTVHEFNIPSLDLQLTQDTWTNVTADQLPGISQLAAEMQVLLDELEAAES